MQYLQTNTSRCVGVQRSCHQGVLLIDKSFTQLYSNGRPVQAIHRLHFHVLTSFTEPST